MDKILFRLLVNVLLFSVLLSGALISCFSDVQKASAAELVPAGNESRNSSISLTDTGKEINSSEESLSPDQKKLSKDLLQLYDERYLSEEESSETLRARMIKLGQLSQIDPVLRRTSHSAEKYQRDSADLEYSASKSSFSSAEKVYVYIYLEPYANSSILDGYCEVEERDEENHLAVAWVPLESLEILASLPEVRSIQTVLPPFVRQGNTVSEGDLILKSSSLREFYGVNGTGIKIGIISDGVDSWRMHRLRVMFLPMCIY